MKRVARWSFSPAERNDLATLVLPIVPLAQGSQGQRVYRYSAQRVRVTRRRKPGEVHWAIYRRNLDGSEPRYYLSNAPEDTLTGDPGLRVGGSRWRIETEFETEQSDVGLGEYETCTPQQVRSGLASPRGPLCLLGGAFLLSLQQDGGKDASDHAGRRSTGWCERCCPGNGSVRLSCCGGSRIRKTVQRTGQTLPRQAPLRPSRIPAHSPWNRRCNTGGTAAGGYEAGT